MVWLQRNTDFKFCSSMLLARLVKYIDVFIEQCSDILTENRKPNNRIDPKWALKMLWSTDCKFEHTSARIMFCCHIELDYCGYHYRKLCSTDSVIALSHVIYFSAFKGNNPSNLRIVCYIKIINTSKKRNTCILKQIVQGTLNLALKF